jgi:hypothetical protein
MKCGKTKAVTTFLVLIITIGFFVSAAAAQQRNGAQLYATREATIDVKVILVGIDQQYVMKDYSDWNNPVRRNQLTLIPGVSTGTTYLMHYTYAFAPDSFTQEFTAYLNSVAKTERRINVLWNESYFKISSSYFLNYTHFPINATNTYYPADQVESWLLGHAQDFGGLETPGYTLMLADLSTKLPSVTGEQFQTVGRVHPAILTPHFYNKTYTDHDLGVSLNRRYMTSWGGHGRFYFVDLSAGPGSAAEQLPIQLSSWVNKISPNTAYWPYWLTQYLSDYITGAVYNLFAPDLIYPLNYAQTYRLKIFVLDNRTDSTPPIQSTIDTNEIKTQVSSLLPFAKVQVDTQFLKLSDNSELFKVVQSAVSPSLTGLTPVVDARPIYNWLSQSAQGNINQFTKVTRDSNTYDIPIFVFAFQGEYNFGFTYKELIAKEIDFDRTIWGVSLYDLVLISHSANDFHRGDFIGTGASNERAQQQPGRGFGFTNTIIHETGHMLGLVHPFEYDPTENFVSSVMAYYPYEDIYSQFDKDYLLRGYADMLIRGATLQLRSATFDLLNWSEMNAARNDLGSAEAAYSSMNYAEAAEASFSAYQNSSQANILGGGGSLSGQSSVWAVAALSFMAGAVIVYVVTRRKVAKLVSPVSNTIASKCSVCGSDLTWIQQYQRWYCYKCRRYE